MAPCDSHGRNAWLPQTRKSLIMFSVSCVASPKRERVARFRNVFENAPQSAKRFSRGSSLAALVPEVPQHVQRQRAISRCVNCGIEGRATFTGKTLHCLSPGSPSSCSASRPRDFAVCRRRATLAKRMAASALDMSRRGAISRCICTRRAVRFVRVSSPRES